MSRRLVVAAAQMGPIQKAEGRDVAVGRMVALMEKAARRGAEVVVYPELALTTFFPRWYHEDLAEADHWYEHAMPSNATAPLFEAARRLNIGFHLGYAEKTADGRRFNTAVYVHPSGEVVLKYRKVHLPGHAEYDPVRRVQHLEKRYFEPGDLGFPVVRAPVGAAGPVNIGMMICNDRRWPEAWRVLGLQQVELVMLGYNTPSLNMENRGFEAHHLRVAHSHLSIQAGATRMRASASAWRRPGPRTGTSCSATRSSSTRKGRSWPRPPAGTTNSSSPTATSACASWGAARSSTSPATAGPSTIRGSPPRPAARRRRSGRRRARLPGRSFEAFGVAADQRPAGRWIP
jgi:predicted amidohydrolase